MIIPFFIPHAGCPHQCVFCNQKRITGAHAPAAPEHLSVAIDAYCATNRNDRPPEAAFFGGTFTALPREIQAAYLDAVAPFLRSGKVGGIRISTRPDAIDPVGLALLKQGQVGTVELGVQSLDDEVLRASGRGHTAADTVVATGLLREQGFSVGFQLMPGLPGDTRDRFRATVRRSIELQPDMVRIYPALVVRDTPLEQLFHAGRYTPLTLDEAVAWCAEAADIFHGKGIPLIRLGLQSTGELESAGAVVAGPYHPAFGQLVESALFLGAMQRMLDRARAGASAVFRVNPRDLSTAIGQKRKNILVLKQTFRLDEVRFVTDPAVARGTVLPA